MTPFFRKLQAADDRPDQRLMRGHEDFDSLQQEPANHDIRLGDVRATFGHVERDEQIHRLQFMRGNQHRSESQDEDWEERHSPWNFIILASLLIVLVVLGWFGYRWFTNTYNEVPPIVMADESPYKIRPENPGGITIPHQDKLIYGRITPQNYATPERLLPQPEQPVLPEHQSYAQPMYGPQQNGYGPQDSNQMMQSPHHQAESQQGQYPYHMAPSVPPGQQAYAPQQPTMQPHSPQGPAPQGYVPHGYGHQPVVPQYQQSAQPIPQPQAQDPYYRQQPMPSQQPSQPYESTYGNTGHIHQQEGQPMTAAQAPALAREAGISSDEAVQSEEPVEASKDPLDELLSSEASIVEKIGSTKLKLASLNNDSPFASARSAKPVMQKETPKTLPADGSYRVQLGSFTTEKDAKNEVRRLKSLDHSIFSGKKFIIQKSTSSATGNTIYKVMVGFFPTANTATTFKNKMKIHRLNGIVIKSAS